jgi:hypothetical protein
MFTRKSNGFMRAGEPRTDNNSAVQYFLTSYKSFAVIEGTYHYHQYYYHHHDSRFLLYRGLHQY